MLVVAARGMTPSHPQQACDGLFGDLHEPRRCPHTTAFPQVADAILCGGLGALRMAQGRATAFGAFLSAGATAQQAETIMPIHLPDAEVVRPGATKQLAFGMDTGERVQVGSFPEGLLENS